jgi:lipopolysaccharide/colanic/teichoic acid biosynthesis glycosyltransferase
MTLKRALDIVLSLLILGVAAPVLIAASIMIVAHDGRTPFYRGYRVGRDGRDFRMVKLRTMAIGAELRGGSSTARSDARVTPLGHFLRRWKLDELPQFWNVLRGEMSIVGPRPNVRREVARYTAEEMRLLSVRPGITDLSSIVFSDEAEILEGAADPDAQYDRIIRPWKSRLGLLYVDHRDFGTDLRLIGLTALTMISRARALKGVDAIAAKWGADERLRATCRRQAAPTHAEPPGVAA